jgi:site-specific DNA-methyltransferase (adenine-specific)
MIIEQMLNNAQKPLLHIADVSGSALFQGDCLDIMPLIPDSSIDMIFTDPPYGTTVCKWDSVIPFDKMWEQLKRIIKPNGVILLFGSEPFSSFLRTSNIEMYKYDWIWEKPNGSDPFQCRKRPMNNIENISVFYKKQPFYLPQMTESKNYKRKGGTKEIEIFGCVKDASYESNQRYPMRILKYNKEGQIGSNEERAKNSFHPTQKPILLLENLIKTYTNENETILDFTMGSGSSMVASKNLNRKFIGIEKEANYYEIACRRCGF